MNEWRLIELDRGDSGVRVDRVLLRHVRDVPRVSRNQIQKWIESGDVLINGAPPPRPAWRVQSGDELRVRVAERRPRLKPRAERIPLDVLYEDDHMLVVNKPPGLVVHPSYKNTSGTLMNGVLAHAEVWPVGSKPALLGRLDKNTSGVVIVTKRPSVHAALQRAMDARRIDKDYLAIVWGKPVPVRGTIDLALDRDPWDQRRVVVTDRGGQPSVTKYERLESRGGRSLLRCRLITGRTHQIRVHLAAKGWPIVGDATYGRQNDGFPRQALHSWRVSFRHPIEKTAICITAPLPDDMRDLAKGSGIFFEN